VAVLMGFLLALFLGSVETGNPEGEGEGGEQGGGGAQAHGQISIPVQGSLCISDAEPTDIRAGGAML
jgi:hypothetical protein